MRTSIDVTEVQASPVVVHANWTGGALAIWGESAASAGPDTGAQSGDHPRALAPDEVASLLGVDLAFGADSFATLSLPSTATGPQLSPHLAHATGHMAHAEVEEGSSESEIALAVRQWKVPVLSLDAASVDRLLGQMEERALDSDGSLILSDSFGFFALGARFVRSLIAEQRFVPALVPAGSGELQGQWRAWLADKQTAARFDLLLDSMPPACRAVVDENQHEARPILEDFLDTLTDVAARRALRAESMIEAVEDWDDKEDEQVVWLRGLLDNERGVMAGEDNNAATMLRTIRRWIGRLEDRGPSGPWQLLLRLNEPITIEGLADLEAPGDELVWTVSIHLQSVDNPSLEIDAEDIWTLRTESATVAGKHVEAPRDLILRELGRASRLFPLLERALEEATPTELELNTKQAYEFLREIRPVLLDQGFGVGAPSWWESPSARLGARLQLDGQMPDEMALGGSASAPGGGPSRLGLQAIVGYHWNIAIGDTPISLEEFEKLAKQRVPLVRLGGQWVEVRPEDVSAALKFIRENPGGEMGLGDALRLAFGIDRRTAGVSILGVDASGWVDALLSGELDDGHMPMLEAPKGFEGELRPYQLKGLSWLAYLDRIGLGPCLADDMGLGKTIQLLALLSHERETAKALREQGASEERTHIGPTLLVVPMSIVANWAREAKRFTPGLRVLVHHGLERKTGDSFLSAAIESDLVITTYALANRDRELLELVPWRRLVLDEAQNIKNPTAKQSQAVRAFDAPRRIALTGTPLENRLSELWSIMDFLNTGFLGSLGEFRRHFSIPIERHHNRDRAGQLRGLVRPFILRRLKTDPRVISDLPEKIESKEMCKLTSEQAALYETCVQELLTAVDESEGIKRRGMVLTTLIRLKQICDHPALSPFADEGAGSAYDPSRSGKCIRLIEMLEEIMAAGDQALVFTQFRQMGEILASMLRHTLDREVLLFHGGTSAGQRDKIVEAFQKGDGSNPILVLSLKAGGVGLNLTAASHVFHFDRWWNPAVENQATDRAFRIGQKRTVNVHKFLVGGTLEDRIDQMIESKIALAEDVIGSGEDWLTELSSAQLRDVLKLRPEAFADV